VSHTTGAGHPADGQGALFQRYLVSSVVNCPGESIQPDQTGVKMHTRLLCSQIDCRLAYTLNALKRMLNMTYTGGAGHTLNGQNNLLGINGRNGGFCHSYLSYLF
jgi:hypothetical protein